MPFDRPGGTTEPDERREGDRPEPAHRDHSHLPPSSDLVPPYLSRAAHREQIAALDDDDRAEGRTVAEQPEPEDKTEDDDRQSAWDTQREAVEKDRLENPRRLLATASVSETSADGGDRDNQAGAHRGDGTGPTRPVRLEERADRGQQQTETDASPELGRLFKTVTEELGESKTWSSFSSAKREIRARLGHQPGIEVDHIVEQCQSKPERSGIPQEQINSSDNMARIRRDVHIEKSARYSRIPFGESEPLRNTLNGESWEDQHETGCDILNEAIERRREHND